MAAHGCHLSIGFWYVLLVITESFFLAVRDTMIARTVLYKVSIAIVSRSFYEKPIAAASIRFSLPQLPVTQRTWISHRLTPEKVWAEKDQWVIQHGGNNSPKVVIKVVTTLPVQA
jgi:hypothetical protein